MKRIIMLSLIFTLPSSIAAVKISEQEKIVYLIKQIETSKLIFVRNGSEYPPKEAKAHLEKKLKWAGNRIKTADDFIRKIASRSSLSGKPYYIKLPDGTLIKTETWLRSRLKKLNETQRLSR